MFFRFLFTSLTRWVLNMLLVVAMLKYIIPSEWPGMATAAPIWVMSFLLAFGLAEWAFRTIVPTKQSIAVLLLNWLIVNLTLDILFAYYIIGTAAAAVKSADHWVTYMVEIAAIFLAAYVTRRRNVREMMSEGIEL